jgi:hypothetical protein
MKLAFAAIALLLLMAVPAATAQPCPPESPPDRHVPPCAASPILVSLGNCASFFLESAHEWQVYAGDTVGCL